MTCYINNDGLGSFVWVTGTWEGTTHQGAGSNHYANEIMTLSNGGNLYVAGTISASNLSGTNTGDQTNISGNAATATYATSAGALSSMNISQFTNNSGYITSGDTTTGIFTTFLGNGTSNIGSGYTRVIRNENGLGGNPNYGPILHIAASDTMWQIVGPHAGQTNLVWRSGYSGAWDTPWWTIYHSGNFTNNSSNWNTAFGWGNHASAGYLTSVTNISGNAGTVTNGVYTTGTQTIGGLKTFSSTIENSATADWYMYGFGARGASSGQYGIGLKADIADRTLSFHVPDHVAYSSTGAVPKFGWYSNGAVELMTLTSASGNLTVTGTTSATRFNLTGTGAFMEAYGSYSSKLGRVAIISLDWNANYDQPFNHGITSTDSAGNFADSLSINSFNDITLRLDSNNNNVESYVRVMNNTQGANTIAHIGYNGANGVASFSRDLYVNGGTGGNFGNRIVVGADSTPYTLQDTNIRPTVYVTGAYPVVALNHTVTGNTNHGPTVQFTFDGLSQRQWVIGCGGSGEFMDFGFSNSTYGNSNWNPHNGIAGYAGNTIMRIIDNAVGIGGDFGAHGSGGNPAYTLDVRGTIYSNTDMRAPIFYDSANTGYYGDFASTSVMNAIRFGTSTNNGTLSGNSEWGMRLTTDNGYIQFGPANSSWAHIYASQSFYFNQDLYVNGNIVITSANYNSYSPTLTGGNASGTWAINVTGSSGSISGFNNPTTASTANTIVYRDAVGDVAAREFVLTSSTVHTVTPSSIVGIYPTTNQVVKFSASAVQTFLGLGSLAYSSATIPTNNNQLTNGAGYITGISFASVSSKPTTISGYGITDALSNDQDSEQTVGGKVYCFNSGAGRINLDPRWNDSGYDADLGCLHLWSWTAAGVAYGRAGIAFYSGSAYQYLTTKASTTGLFVNNQEIIHAGNIGSQSVASATTFSTTRTNYKGVTDGAVAGQLMWKNYGNLHTIFDASAATSPSGGAVSVHTPDYPVNNSNGSNTWGVNPNLMGWNGSSTYGVKVDWSRYSESTGSVAWTNVSSRPTALSQFSNDLGNYGGWITGINSGNVTTALGFTPYNATNPSGYITSSASISGNAATATYATTAGSAPANGGNSATVGGYAPSGSVGANTVVIRDANNYIYAHYINSNVSETENPTINSFYTSNGDGWLRKSSVAHVKSQLGLGSMAYESSGTYQTVSGAINTGNIASQSVSYATISQQLTKFGDIYGQDWNSYFITAKLIVSNALGHTGANRPSDSYGYGTVLSYGETGGPLMQMYFPEDVGNTGGAYRALAYRSGYNGSWSAWKTVVNQVGNTCTVAGSNGTGLQVHSNVGYNQNPLTYFLLRGQADSSWKTFKILLTGDAGGQDIEFRRIAENSTDARIFYVPRGANQVIFDYTVVQPSDSRLKDNLTPITNPVDKIKSLRGVEFDWNSGEHVGTHDVGLIAQDVEAVLPEAVTTQEDGYKNLAYTKVIPLLVEAMKEQQTMIEALRAEIELLKNK
jgi:hypothetical protein